jgi:hypothetical protein
VFLLKFSASVPLIDFYFFVGIPVPVEMGRVPVQAGISSLCLVSSEKAEMA